MPSPQPSSGLVLSMVQLPGRMRWGLGLFRKITGLTAVTSLVTPLVGPGPPSAMSPPVHPRCATRLRTVRTAPCRKQWFIHVRSGRRSPGVHSHTCPIRLRCSCVPIHIDGHLIGAAKLVVGSETSDQAFSAATSVLTLIVSGISQGALVSELLEELRTLRQCLAQYRQIQSKGAPVGNRFSPSVTTSCPEAWQQRRHLTLVEGALSHLHQHYQTSALSLPVLAAALGCNPRYLTTSFTQTVGEHMHTYLVRLRVAHACRLLMETNIPIKEAAFASGFRGGGGLAQAFRRHVGVSPGEYRRIFAGR